MITDADIITEARSWLGTPWKHGVALKGWGADCGQIIIAIAKHFGWIPADFSIAPYHADYSLHNTRSLMREELQRMGFTEAEDKSDWRVGDVLLFLNGKCEAHAALAIGPDELIHAHIRHGVIVAQYRQIKDGHLSTWRRP